MNRDELQAIQAGNVEDVAKVVDGIESAEDLAALREMEEADGSPRKGVLEAIEKRLEDLASANAPAPKAQKVPKAAPPAPPAPPAPWKARDYSGPLTGDQAAWRNKHLKPAEAEARKR